MQHTVANVKHFYGVINIFLEIFSERLRLQRKALGLTQLKLAEKIGVCRGAVEEWENRKKGTGFDNLVAIANALNVTTDYLLGRTDDPYFTRIKTDLTAS
jgi:transcriptional regulator with XRE-family HTH domain